METVKPLGMDAPKPAEAPTFTPDQITAALNDPAVREHMQNDPAMQEQARAILAGQGAGAAEHVHTSNGHSHANQPLAIEGKPNGHLAINGAPERLAIESGANAPGNAVVVRPTNAVSVNGKTSKEVAKKEEVEVLEGELEPMTSKDLVPAAGKELDIINADAVPADKKKDKSEVELFDDTAEDRVEAARQEIRDREARLAEERAAAKGGDLKDDAGEKGKKPEVKLADFNVNLDKWAKAKKKYEDKVGFLGVFNKKSKQEAAVKEAEKEVAEQIANLEGVDATTKIQLWGQAINAVGKRQEELSKEKKWYHSKGARIVATVGLGVALGTAVIATGGLAGLPVALAAAIKGGAVGITTALASARMARNAANTKQQTAVRVSGQQSNLNLAQGAGEDYSTYSTRTGEALRGLSSEHRTKNEKSRRKQVIIGGVGGAALGFILGGGLSGDAGPTVSAEAPKDVAPPTTETSGPVLEVPSKEAIAQAVIEDPTKAASVPGLEGVDIDVVTPEEAASQYDGKYVWDSLENGSGITNDQQTFKAFMEGWDKLHDVPGVNIDTWGDVHFDESSGTYETTGDRWGANVTVEDLHVVDANGDVHTFDGKLTTAQHAELLDLTRQEGAQFLSGNDSLRDFLAEQITASPDQMKQVMTNAVDQLNTEINSEWQAVRADAGPLPAEDLESLRQDVIQRNVAQHAQLVASLPDSYRDLFVAKVSQGTAIPEGAIRQMIQSAFGLAA